MGDVVPFQDMDGLDLGSVESGTLLTLLECPVCLDHITPPIRQCIKGHLVCMDCFPRLKFCPTCREEMSKERNLVMEQVSRLLRYPCRYHPMGCRESFTLAKKFIHERDCHYLQLKCPFHGQCTFNGTFKDVIPHLASEHSVTPVPVQPLGTLFYRAKNFHRRLLWALIFMWDGNLFRFLVKTIHASNVGRSENGNLVIGHIQYVGPESMAARYSYQISLFNSELRRTGHDFEGLVTSMAKPLESMCGKSEVFVTTIQQARLYLDAWCNLNFIIRMKKLLNEDGSVATPGSVKPCSIEPSTSSSPLTQTPSQPVDPPRPSS